MASGSDRPYVVMQVTLKEKFLGTGSGNLVELENVINKTGGQGLSPAHDLDFRQR